MAETDTATLLAARGTVARILAGARACIEANGIERTTIVDIAEAAGYSRPIIYKHFADKAAIVDRLCLEEMLGIQQRLNLRLDRTHGFAGQMVHAILLGVVLARDNPYIRLFMKDHASWVRSQTEGGLVHDWVSGQWNRFLLRGRQEGLLAADIDIGETVTWIALIQSLLLIRFESDAIDEAQIRRYLARFVVAPLLA